MGDGFTIIYNCKQFNIDPNASSHYDLSSQGGPSIDINGATVTVRDGSKEIAQFEDDSGSEVVIINPKKGFNINTDIYFPRAGKWINKSGEIISGASDTDMDLSRYGLIDEGGLGGRFNEGNTESAVYASALWNEDKSEIAINYHFFFPRSVWGRYGGRNIHEGDWEGATVFLKSEEGEWAPDKVAVGQHIKLGTSDGGDRYEEDDERLAWEGSHIKLYVGLGGHALYTYSDVRNIWGLGEKHDGNIQYNSAENTIYITPLPCA